MKKKVTFSELINNSKPVLVDFYADWCGPCKAMNPILKEVAQELGESASIVKINVDQNPTVAQQFGIRGIPTFILFKEGNVQWRHSGMLSAHHLEQVIKEAV